MSKIRPNPLFPTEAKPLSRELGVLWRELATNVNATQDLIDGNGGNGNRWGSGVETTDDIIITNANAGLILKSYDGTYWRVQVDDNGILRTTDVGTDVNNLGHSVMVGVGVLTITGHAPTVS